MPRLPLLLRVFLLLVVLPSAAFASVTKGTLKGQTIDEGGLAIPGVLITASSESMMGVRQMSTDPEGRFYFNDLPPGDYSVSAEKAGFAKVSKTNVIVSVGRVANITIELPLATAAEEIVVEEKGPAVDTESAQRGSVLTKEFLECIPAGVPDLRRIQRRATLLKNRASRSLRPRSGPRDRSRRMLVSRSRR